MAVQDLTRPVYPVSRVPLTPLLKPLSRVQQPKLSVVLMSGGPDSAACVAFCRERAWSVDALFIDYGQAAAGQERRAARKVCRSIGVKLHERKTSASVPKTTGEVVGRNALFALMALMEFPSADIIAMGIHKGTPYYDCSPEFLKCVQGLFDGYTGGRARIFAPFISMTKRQVWNFALSADVPVQFTYSCQRGGVPCGRCPSCLDRKALDALPHN